jgi:hypothetical protein
MELHLLLEELIQIAQKTKTDFATSIRMTPSGLSKILTGKRLPTSRERKVFTKLAAEYFAESIYAPNCHLKFKDLYPVIYEFQSKNELLAFLSYGIEYAMDKNFAQESSVNFDYAERGFYFLGHKPVINWLCVILSEYLMEHKSGEPLELYSTLPMWGCNYHRILKRIVITNPKLLKGITFNHIISETRMRETQVKNVEGLVSLFVKANEYCNLNLWSTPNPIPQHFLLIKGHVLLILDNLDETPFLTPISHKSYLILFYNSLFKDKPKKISFRTDEVIAYLKENPQQVAELMTQTESTTYSFLPMGYLLEKDELKQMHSDETLVNFVEKVHRGFLAGKMYFSVASMERLVAFGKLIVPLLGTMVIPPRERARYLQRFNQFFQDEQWKKVTLINGELGDFAMVFTQDAAILYAVNSDGEKFHIFRQPQLRELLKNSLLAETNIVFELSPDLWKAYQEDLLNNHSYLTQP